MNVLINKTNAAGGFLTTLFAGIFGQFWFLFVGFLAMNFVDWITGWCAARKKGEESSAIGAKGIAKKVWYWVVIAVSFYIAYAMGRMGELLGIDLSFLMMVGWFVLANYLVNEIRSILENLIQLQVEIPVFLMKGLQIASDTIDKTMEGRTPKE